MGAADRAEEIVRSMMRWYEEEGGNKDSYDVKPDMGDIYLVYSH